MSDSSGVPVMQPHVPTGFSLDSSLGVLLIATLLSMTCVLLYLFSSWTHWHMFRLWGVTCVQTYEYFLNNTDGLFQRSIVSFYFYNVLSALSVAVGCFAFVGFKSYPFRMFCLTFPIG